MRPRPSSYQRVFSSDIVWLARSNVITKLRSVPQPMFPASSLSANAPLLESTIPARRLYRLNGPIVISFTIAGTTELDPPTPRFGEKFVAPE